LDIDRSVCVVIPARYASTRFPGKPLAMIKDRPLIQHVYDRCRKAENVDKLVVATDDQRIYDTVIGFGGDVVMTSVDHPSGTDRIAQAVSGIDCDFVINVQGDEPLIEPELIDLIIDSMICDNSVVVSTPIALIKDGSDFDNPNVVKVVRDLDGNALYFSRYAIPFVRDGKTTKCYKHIGLYGYKKDFLLKLIKYPQSELEKAECLEQLRILENGFKIKTVVTDYEGVGVDRPEDLEEVERRL